MKSGTNWLCRLLKVHPAIDCVGEFHWESFFHALRDNTRRIAPRRQDRLDEVIRPRLEQMVKQCLIEFAAVGATVIGDRTPTTIAPVILPGVPHLVMIRDCRDVLVSRMFHLFNHPRVTGVFDRFPEMQRRRMQFEKDHWYFRDRPEELLAHEGIVRDSAREWAQHQIADRETVDRHPSLPVRLVRYEELHADFDSQCRRLFDFLQLEPPQSLPDALRPGHDAEQPDRPNRKGQVGDWRHYMTDQAKKWINLEAGPELIRQGYIDSESW